MALQSKHRLSLRDDDKEKSDEEKEEDGDNNRIISRKKKKKGVQRKKKKWLLTVRSYLSTLTYSGGVYYCTFITELEQDSAFMGDNITHQHVWVYTAIHRDLRRFQTVDYTG